MHRFIRKVTGLVIGLSIMGTTFSYAAQAPVLDTIYEHTTTEQIAKGLVYDHKEKLTDAGWLDIHVMKMDMNEPTLSLDVIRDVETFALGNQLSEMADQDTKFVGGINGSFFSMGTMLGEVKGVEVNDGLMAYAIDDYNLYNQQAANLIVDQDGMARFDFLDISLVLKTSSGYQIRLQGINSHSVFPDAMIFNRNAYEDMDYVDTLGDLYKVVIEDGLVKKVTSAKEHIEVPENGYVMTFPKSDPENYRSRLPIGSKVSIEQTSNFDPQAIDLAIAGGGYIIKDGILSDDGLLVGTTSRHPRTAVGLTEDGQTLIAIVVDGRGRSIGATHRELADYLFEYDVYNAIHMDGGGSSTMINRPPGSFNNTAVNTPSDGYERPIVNGLGFVMTAPETTEFNLHLKSDKTRAFVNNKIDLELLAYDLNFNPVSVADGLVAWSMEGGYGTMDDMTFTPKSAGTVTLTGYFSGRSASIELQIVDELIDLEIVPKVLHLDDGQQQMTVVGTDSQGYKSVIDNELLEWSIDEPVGTVENGLFVPGEAGRTAKIAVKYGDTREYAYVVSGMQETLLTNFEGVTADTLVYPDTVVGSSQVISDQGSSKVEITYDLVASDAAQAVYAVFEDMTITEEVDHVVLHVEDYPQEVMLKGHIRDSHDEQYTLTFEESSEGVARALVPSSLSYPIELTRVYVVATEANEAISGQLLISDMLTAKKNDAEDLTDVMSIPPVDELYETYPAIGFDVKIFGATSGRNRLLDEVVMTKVYDVFNDADYAIYAGSSDVDASKITNDYMVYEDTFDTVDLDPVRIISLGMGAGSMVKTEAKQWDKLALALSTTVQETIVIIGTEQLVNNTDQSFSREGELIHQTLSDFASKSGKHIFYVNASGYNYDLSFYEGIRYIDLNGLWYRVDEDHSVDLYDSFQTVNLSFGASGVTYKVEDLYPKTVVIN